MIRYIKYPRFSEIPKDIRNCILITLGISGGMMRGAAKRYNPLCMVGFDQNIPIGWACYFPNKGKILYCFVKPGYRRRGIGTELMNRLLSNWGEIDGLTVYFENKVAEAFFLSILSFDDNCTVNGPKNA
jgi:GNAT superfamily N-acetyltransferase